MCLYLDFKVKLLDHKKLYLSEHAVEFLCDVDGFMYLCKKKNYCIVMKPFLFYTGSIIYDCIKLFIVDLLISF